MINRGRIDFNMADNSVMYTSANMSDYIFEQTYYDFPQSKAKGSSIPRNVKNYLANVVSGLKSKFAKSVEPTFTLCEAEEGGVV